MLLKAILYSDECPMWHMQQKKQQQQHLSAATDSVTFTASVSADVDAVSLYIECSPTPPIHSSAFPKRPKIPKKISDVRKPSNIPLGDRAGVNVS